MQIHTILGYYGILYAGTYNIPGYNLPRLLPPRNERIDGLNGFIVCRNMW